MITTKLRRALSVGDPLGQLVEEPCPGVFVFDAFSPVYCRRLLTELEKQEFIPPNSMNKYGVVLKDIGMDPLCQYLLTTLVRPLAERFYPRVGALRKIHGFLVNYDPKKQRSLDLHNDESDVTLNVCLGREFTGGQLVFRNDKGKILAKIDHAVGQAVLHLGDQLHQAKNIRTGQRSNLILWCSAKKSSYV